MPTGLWAIVPAGGTGSRMNAAIPKQYLTVRGYPVIEHTLMRLCQCPSIEKVVVGIAREDMIWQKLAFRHEKLVAVVKAGSERADTVENCLRRIVGLGGQDDWVLVHDAARPCVRIADIERLVEAVIGQDAGGLLALPVTDTIKHSGIKHGGIKHSGQGRESGRVLQTVAREGLWRAMTPQLFRIKILVDAIQQARHKGVDITDEASAMESVGFAPLLVPCAPDNIKITLPQDIRFAEIILQVQQTEQAK